MENIYAKYRRLSGLTQEKASELLEISVDSLKGYEYDKRIPPNDVAQRMCEVYNDKKLAYDHLINSSTGAIFLDELTEKDLCCSVLGLINELNHSDNVKKLMIEITADSIIDDDEAEDWSKVEQQIRDLIKASYEVLFRR